MKAFRKVLFWCHMAAGLTAGALVLVMSVTGVLLTYEKQVVLIADTRASGFARPAGDVPPLAPEALLAKVVEAGVSPATLALRADGSVPASVTLPGGGQEQRTLFVDPFTGAVLGEGAVGTHRFFRAVTDWHRWLGRQGDGRATGKAVTGAANLLFLFIVASGLYVWVPRSWTPPQFKQVLWLKRGISARARDFNWHNVIGFWSCVPLFVIVFAGVVISYPWASDLVYRVAGEAPSGPPGGRPGRGPGGPGRASDGRSVGVSPAAWAGLDTAVNRAQAHRADWKTLTVRLPREAEAPLVSTVDAGTGGEPQKRETLTLDRTGNVVKVERFSDGTLGRRWRALLRFTHTGEVLGWAGQTMAGLTSLGACFLCYTGAALSWRRWRAWRQRRANRPVELRLQGTFSTGCQGGMDGTSGGAQGASVNPHGSERSDHMNTRTLSVLLIGLALTAPVFAQGRQRATSVNQPPVASTDAERRILGILDQMVASGSLHLAVPADNGRMLRLLAETTGARNVVEIGTSTGYSGLWISLALQRTGGKLTTFELDPGRAAEARKHFEQAGVTGLVEVIVGDAHENVKRLKGPIDLLFLDADKEGYASYLKTLLPLVRPGGLIAADNVTMAADYMKAVTTDPQLDTVFFGRFAVTLKKRQ